MLDSFTAGSLLNAAMQGGDAQEQVYGLFKEMKNNGDGGPSTAARDFFVKHKDKKCKITGTGHEGIIYRLNEATAGFYPGSRYPIKIQITSDTAKGAIFEYDLDQIEVIE